MQLRRVFAEGGPDWLEEASRSDLDAEQVIELLDTQTFFELLKLPYPTDRSGVLDRMVQERLIDKRDPRYSIRRLGALLLAKELKHFEDVARRAPRVVVYTGTGLRQDKARAARGARGYAAGFRGADSAFMGQLARERSHRRRAPRRGHAVPRTRHPRAGRQCVIIHQDFNALAAAQSVMKCSTPTEWRSSNPGEPLVETERFPRRPQLPKRSDSPVPPAGEFVSARRSVAAASTRS